MFPWEPKVIIVNAEHIQLLLSATAEDATPATPGTLTSHHHPIPIPSNIPSHLLIPPTPLPQSLSGNSSILRHVPPPQSTPIYPKKVEDLSTSLRDTAAELLQSIISQLNDPNGDASLGIDLSDLPTDQAGLDKFLGEFVAALNSEEDLNANHAEGSAHADAQNGLGSQLFNAGFTSLNGYAPPNRQAAVQDAEAKRAEKAKVRQENRERKKRWREFNADRNKDNDLRCRVVKRATKIFGPQQTLRKKAWVEDEFQKRKHKREAKERARNQDPYAPFPEFTRTPATTPNQPAQTPQPNPISAELRPVQNDPALLSAIETLAAVARSAEAPNLNATELVKLIISDPTHLELFSTLIRENQQKRSGGNHNVAPNPPNSFQSYSNQPATPTTNNGYQTPLGQTNQYLDFNNQPITANSSRSNSIQDTPSPTSSSFSDLISTPVRGPLGTAPSTPIVMQNQPLLLPTTPLQPSQTPQAETPIISTATMPAPAPVSVHMSQQAKTPEPSRILPAQAPRAPVAPVAPVAPMALTAHSTAPSLPIRSLSAHRAPMAPMAPVAPMAPTAPRATAQEANKWSFGSSKDATNVLLPSLMPMPAPTPPVQLAQVTPIPTSPISVTPTQATPAPVTPVQATPVQIATAQAAPVQPTLTQVTSAPETPASNNGVPPSNSVNAAPVSTPTSVQTAAPALVCTPTTIQPTPAASVTPVAPLTVPTAVSSNATAAPIEPSPSSSNSARANEAAPDAVVVASPELPRASEPTSAPTPLVALLPSNTNNGQSESVVSTVESIVSTTPDVEKSQASSSAPDFSETAVAKAESLVPITSVDSQALVGPSPIPTVATSEATLPMETEPTEIQTQYSQVPQEMHIDDDHNIFDFAKDSTEEEQRALDEIIAELGAQHDMDVSALQEELRQAVQEAKVEAAMIAKQPVQQPQSQPKSTDSQGDIEMGNTENEVSVHETSLAETVTESKPSETPTEQPEAIQQTQAESRTGVTVQQNLQLEPQSEQHQAPESTIQPTIQTQPVVSLEGKPTQQTTAPVDTPAEVQAPMQSHNEQTLQQEAPPVQQPAPAKRTVIEGLEGFPGLEGMDLDDETLEMLKTAMADDTMLAELVDMLKDNNPPVEGGEEQGGVQSQVMTEAAAQEIRDVFSTDTAMNTAMHTPMNTGMCTPLNNNMYTDFDEFEKQLAEIDFDNLEGDGEGITLDQDTINELLEELKGMENTNANNSLTNPMGNNDVNSHMNSQMDLHINQQMDQHMDQNMDHNMDHNMGGLDDIDLDVNELTQNLTDEDLAALLSDEMLLSLTPSELSALGQNIQFEQQQAQEQHAQGMAAATIEGQLEGIAKDLSLDEATHHALRQLVQVLEHNPSLIQRCISGELDLSALSGQGTKRGWDGNGEQGMSKRVNTAPTPSMSGLNSQRPISSNVPPRPPYSTTARSAKADEDVQAYKASFGNSAAMNRRLMAPPAFRTPSITYGFSTSIPPKKKTDENKVKSMGFPPMLAGLKKPTPPTPQCT